MKNTIQYVSILFMSIFLLGCGEDKPEDVATSLVKSLSKAQLSEAKKLVSDVTLKEIVKLSNLCNKIYYEELIESVLKISRKMNNERLGNTKFNFKTFMDETKIDELRKELEEKYGNPEDRKKLPLEKQKKFLDEMTDKFSNRFIKPMVEKFIDVFNVDVKHLGEVKEIFSKYFSIEITQGKNMFISKHDRVLNIIEKGNYQKSENINPECIAKYTDYGFVESVNMLEVTNSSPDEAIVRLELIDKNEKSKKVSVTIEKIKGEWKVSESLLNSW